MTQPPEGPPAPDPQPGPWTGGGRPQQQLPQQQPFPSGSQPGWEQQGGQPQWGPPNGQPQWTQQQYGQPQWGQQPWGQQPWGQPQWGQQQWGQPWGQPQWAPPAPTPPAGGRRRALVWTLSGVAALAAVVLVGWAGVVAVRSLADASTGGVYGSTGEQGSPEDTQALLDSLPASLPDCAGTELSGAGDIAAADCGAAGAAPAPSYSMFYVYEDTTALADVFDDDVTADYVDGGFFSEGLDQLPAGADCTTAQGWTRWAGGQVACGVTEEDEVLLVWTDEAHLTEGFLYAPGETQADAAALYRWWQASGALHD